MFWFWLIFIVVGGILFGMSDNNKKAEKYKRDQEEVREMKEELEKFRKENEIPENQIIYYKHGHPLVKKKNFNAFIWKDDENLYFYDKGTRNNIGKITIPIKNIECFAERGEFYKETKITGGGISGGGSSIGGAIKGGILAGGAGAIIGSRKPIKSEPIKSEIVTHDGRETFLNFFIDGRKHSMFFGYKGYDILLDIIPEKEFNSINKNNVAKKSNDISKGSTINQIRELSKLKDEGILTENEFDEKKRELLSKI